ncbi:MAG: sulfotransferase [Kiloniellales bacterium]
MTKETPQRTGGKAGASAKPSAHPLSGADLVTLAQVLSRAGSLPASSLGQVALAVASALGRLPFTVAERGLVAAQRRGRPLDPAPIFLLGHWRSGTTHLYNLLGKGNFAYVDPIAAGLPWEFLTLGRLFRPLLVKALPEGRFIDAMKVTPESPQEDELAIANMSRLSFYHAIYFPKHFERFFAPGLLLEGIGEAERRAWMRRADHLFWKLARNHGNRQLVIKNPVYTARAAMLRDFYPEAKFVHIVRNPHEVFASTRSFFSKLLEALALQPFDHLDAEEITLDTYPKVMRPLIEDMEGMVPGQAIELRFEELESDPLGALAQLYEALDLPGFAEAEPGFRQHLGEVQSYTRAKRQFPERDLALVEDRWPAFLQHWGYGRP